MKKAILLTSIGLFLLSLTQQPYCTEARCAESSIAILITGAIGFLTGGAALTWLANPFLIAAWIVFNRNPKISFFTSAFATLIAFSFLFFNKVIIDEAGNYSLIISYKIGYWFWMMSALTMLIGNIIVYRQSRSTKPVRS